MYHFCAVTGVSYLFSNYQIKQQDNHHETSFISLYHTWLNSQNSQLHRCTTKAMLIDHFNEMSSILIVYSPIYIPNINCLFYGDTSFYFYIDLYPTKPSLILQRRHFSINTPSIHYNSTVSLAVPHLNHMPSRTGNNQYVTIVHGQIACPPGFWSKIKVEYTRVTRRSLGKRRGIDANFKFNPKRLNLNKNTQNTKNVSEMTQQGITRL